MAGKRGRPPGSTNKKGNKVVDNLVAALDFVAPAVKDVVYIGPDHIEAFNGLLSIGCPIQSGIERLCPNYDLLRAAIKRAGETPSLTKIDEGRLGVTGGKFRAVVPCIPEDNVTLADQNDKKYPCDDTIKQGFELLNPILREGSTLMIEASLLLQPDTMVATDRHVMVEFRHGQNFPRVVLPKAFLNTVTNCKKKLVMFGFGEVNGTITFWFEDNSWIQTQLYQEDWPNYANVFATTSAQDYMQERSVPEGMFEAVEHLQEFAENGDVYFGQNAIRSHDDLSLGASYDFPNAPVVNVAFNAKRILMLRNFPTVAFLQDKAIFYSTQPMMRAAIVVSRRHANEPAIRDNRPIPPEMQAPEPAAIQESAPVASLGGFAATPMPPNAPAAAPRGPEPVAPVPEIQDTETFPDWVWADDDFEEIDFREEAYAEQESDGPRNTIEILESERVSFDIDAHNRHAAENMASADPHAAMYPGVETTTGHVIRDIAPQ